MPSAAPPARYDLPWKAAVTHAFHPFMDFYFSEFSVHIDWTRRLRFRDKELAAFGIGAAPIAWVTLAHVLTQQAHHDPDALYAAKLSVTKLLFQHRWKPRRIMVLFDVVNWMMVLPESHQRRYWRAVLRLKKEHEMKLLNPLEQMFFDDGVKSGLKQGLEQGLEQGRTKGASALLERQLAQRFGPLPQTIRKKLEKASAPQVEAWSDALVEAQSLKQVFSN